ncbi:zinc ribbon domain-containing protein [Candidatus Bathyarchaeota archaeon]|nr:zinc ribbon domain-containing protein [Candidatus Bathyarchaeota archaeon]
MVYCHKCGTQNKEDAKFCVNCGINLVLREEGWERQVEEWGEEFGRRAEKWGEQFGERVEDECFGFPHGGAFAGILFGIIILIVGLSFVPGFIPPELREAIEPYFWGLIIVVIGALIIAGSVYRYSRR